MASKSSRRNPLAPGVFPVLDYPTPDIRDTIIYLEVDSRLANYKHPEYGTKYAGPRGNLIEDPWYDPLQGQPRLIGRFDNHELVHVSAADENGMVRWYYARKREDQALYNWELEEPGPNNDGYPTYYRTYVVHREDLSSYFDEYPSNPGDPDNYDVAAGENYLEIGDPDPDRHATPALHDFVYADTRIQRIGDESLDSLFVLVVRRFQRLCDKQTVTESDRYGTVTNTVTFEFHPFVTYEIGSEYPPYQLEEPKTYVIDYNTTNIGCTDKRRIELSVVQIPTQAILSERIDDRFCNLTTERWIDFDATKTGGMGTTMPSVGDEDPTDSTRIVVDATNDAIGQSDLSQFSVTYGVFPTPPVSTTSDNEQWCRINTHAFYDKETTTLPVIGSTYQGETVVDASSADISCGTVREFRITTALIPTPVNTSEVLNRDYCRVITETYYDLINNLPSLPEYGDSHATLLGYQVIEASIDPVGCGELAKYTASYATVPTSKVTDELDDPQYCRVRKDSFYDVAANYTLPAKGTAYGPDGSYIIDAQAEAVGCGDLKQFTITYASLPTPVVETEQLNEDYCQLITESNYDLKTNIGDLTAYGTAHPSRTGYQVVDARVEDIGCGEVAKQVVTYANVPTTPRTDEVDDNDYCRLKIDNFFDLGASYSLPAKGAAYGENGEYVIDAKASAVGCGDLYKYSITYAALPTPVVTTEATSDDFCQTITLTNYVLQSDTPSLPALGTANPGDANFLLVDARLEDIGCGEVRRFVRVYAQIPSVGRYEEAEDPDFCTTTTKVWYALDTEDLPATGTEYEGQRVLSATKQDINCGTVARYTVRTVALPTTKLKSTNDDNTYCRLTTETWYDMDGYFLPDRGTSQGGGIVVDAQSQDINCGGIVKYTVVIGEIPPEKRIERRTDNEQCIIHTETFIDQDTYSVPALDSDHATLTGMKVVNTSETPLGCGGIYQYQIAYAQIPSPDKIAEIEDDTWGRITRTTKYDLNGDYTLPALGDDIDGQRVIAANSEDINCGLLRRFVVDTVALPTAKRIATNEDNIYCTLTTEVYIDLDTHEPPAKGSVVGTEVVVDVSSRDLNLGGLTEYTVVTGAVPSQIRIAERTDDELCTIRTETFVDASTNYTSPALDTDHASITGLKVVNTKQTPLGCGGLYEFEVVYAQVPSPDKEELVEDDVYGRVTQYTKYDSATAPTVTLPALGTTYENETVIEARQDDVNCGTLRRLVIKTASLPTASRFTESDDSTYCRTQVETFIAKDYNVPALGDARGLGFVIDNKQRDLNTGGVTEYSITTGALPSEKRVEERRDEELCVIITETFVDLSTATVPELSDAHPTLAGMEVVNTSERPILCGFAMEYQTVYAQIPSPDKIEYVEDDNYGRITRHTIYDVAGGTTLLPQKGEEKDGQYVLEARQDDINCGTLRKFIYETAALPTTPRITYNEDPEWCKIQTETLVVKSDSYTPPILGSVGGLGNYIEIKKTDLHTGGVSRYELISTQLPTPTQVSERKDDDRCTIRTETFYALDSVYTPPTVNANHLTITGLKCINTQEVPYGCTGVFKYTNTYAEIPSPPRTTEYDDSEFGRVNVDTFYDLDGLQPLPAVGSGYGGAYVIEAKAVDVDCEGLRRYEVHYCPLPTFTQKSERIDNEFCDMQTDVYIDLETSELPKAIGTPHGNGKVVDYKTEAIRGGALVRVSVVSANLPTTKKITISDEGELCDVTTEQWVDVVPPNASVGSSYSGGIAIKVESRDIKCGLLQNTVKTVTLPQEKSSVDTSEEHCAITTTSIITNSPVPKTPGDTVLGGAERVIEYSQTPYICDTIYKEIIKSVQSPTPAKITTIKDERFCDVEQEVWYDHQPFTKNVGDVHGLGTLIEKTDTTICGTFRKITARSAVLPTPERSNESTHPLFCEVERIVFYHKKDLYQFPGHGEFHGQSGKRIIEGNITPLSCGIIVRVELLVGIVPSDRLSGYKIDPLTGKKISYSKKVGLAADLDSDVLEVDLNGDYASVEPYGCGLTLVTQGNMKSPSEAIETYTSITWSFPRVLQEMLLYSWPLKKGGVEIHPQIRWKRHGYNGPCKARIVERWQYSKPDYQQPIILTPTSVTYNCPWFSVNTGPCLHGGATFIANPGNGHPKYAFAAGSSFHVPATDPQDWPVDEFLADFQVRPSNGGYLVREIYITPPA